MTRSDNKKASIEDLISSYVETGSVWKTARMFGMCGQSVHERLKKAGVIKNCFFSEKEKEKIRGLYIDGFLKGDGKLDKLCKEISRTKTAISAWAKKFGLSKADRQVDDSIKIANSNRISERIKKNGHPRGALGLHHSEQTRNKISIASKMSWKNKTESQKNEKTMKMLKTAEKNGTLYRTRKGTWKAGWREINGDKIYFRSKWEANYAFYLEWLRKIGKIINWKHEPRTFWFEKIMRGCRSYLPDFEIVTESGMVEYHEVKGWFDRRSKTKINRMRIYYPEVRLVIIDKAKYKNIIKKMSGIINFE
jgi:hypothetical protein